MFIDGAIVALLLVMVLLQLRKRAATITLFYFAVSFCLAYVVFKPHYWQPKNIYYYHMSFAFLTALFLIGFSLTNRAFYLVKITFSLLIFCSLFQAYNRLFFIDGYLSERVYHAVRDLHAPFRLAVVSIQFFGLCLDSKIFARFDSFYSRICSASDLSPISNK